VQSLNFVEGYPRVKKAVLTSKEKSDVEDGKYFILISA